MKNSSPENISPKIRRVAVSAVIAALYAVLTMLLAPISYGAVQLRISEVLCILPFFIPYSAWGLFAGCLLANMLTGNVFDIIFGSLATLCAGLITAHLGKKEHSMKNCVLACLMPVIFNAVIVGAVITCAYAGLSIVKNLGFFALNALYVGLGEAIVLFALGLPLMRSLPKKKFFSEYIKKLNQQGK